MISYSININEKITLKSLIDKWNSFENEMCDESLLSDLKYLSNTIRDFIYQNNELYQIQNNIGYYNLIELCGFKMYLFKKINHIEESEIKRDLNAIYYKEKIIIDRIILYP